MDKAKVLVVGCLIVGMLGLVGCNGPININGSDEQVEVEGNVSSGDTRGDDSSKPAESKKDKEDEKDNKKDKQEDVSESEEDMNESEEDMNESKEDTGESEEDMSKSEEAMSESKEDMLVAKEGITRPEGNIGKPKDELKPKTNNLSKPDSTPDSSIASQPGTDVSELYNSVANLKVADGSLLDQLADNKATLGTEGGLVNGVEVSHAEYVKSFIEDYYFGIAKEITAIYPKYNELVATYNGGVLMDKLSLLELDVKAVSAKINNIPYKFETIEPQLKQIERLLKECVGDMSSAIYGLRSSLSNGFIGRSEIDVMDFSASMSSFMAAELQARSLMTALGYTIE